MAAVLDAFASKLADVLMGMAKEEVEMLLGVPGEITKLETTLGDLSSILADAERRRIRDSAVERWVRELKDVMYDADDILDLCQIMEGGEDPSSSAVAAPKNTSGCWSIPRILFCFRNPVVAHHIGKKIQALNQRLEDLEKRSSRFGFITQAINSSGYSTSKATDSWSDSNPKTGPAFIQSDIVGEKIDESKKKLTDLLLKKEEDPHVRDNKNVVVTAAITGTGGIGKTTLARMVFNDTSVIESFDKTVWLSINKEVNETGLLQRAIAAFGGDYGGLAGDRALLEHALKQLVRQKKFFMVMDDVWSDKVWNDLLRVPLNDGASGSQVLVTTRDDGVARGVKAQYLHRVDKLEAEDAWILLKKQVVLNENDEADVDSLKDIGIRIVERCDGLPLAVKVLGGLLLNTSRTRDAWMDVTKHFTWSMEGIDDDINKAVYLSYEELPSHLKQCFLFCSLFPKDELIRGGEIGQLWIAQGYIIHNKLSSKLPEDMAFEYYKELISRNLLEPNKQYYNHSACTMHDVVRSFAQYITKDEAVLISEGKDFKRAIGTSKVRHISISSRPVERDTLEKQASLRTLMLFGSRSTMVELMQLLKNLSGLRVLYLDGVNVVDFPDSICRLEHLRCLCLTRTSISTIPQDIGDLKFLQAISIASCSKISQLPNSILKLQELRSINFRGTEITSVPRGIGKLKDLVVMLGFPTHSEDSTDEWCSLEELGPLSMLQGLDIRALEKAPSGSMAAKALLSSKHHLTDLDLIFTSRLGENGEVKDDISEEEHKRIEDVLANLCPPTCIELLEIEGYFARGLPKWMRTMSTFGSLRRLELVDYACCTRLPNGLGQLPFLDCFWVERAPSIQCIGHDFLLPSLSAEAAGGKEEVAAIMLAGTQTEMRQPHHISRDGGVAFPKLTQLGLQGMLGWTEWEWEQHVPAMPALETLDIRSCKLQRLPTGLAHHACRLRELKLMNVQHLVSVENLPSLVKLWSYDNPRLERISNNPSLQWIDISKCPALKELDGLPSLRSLEWWDRDAEVLPE